MSGRAISKMMIAVQAAVWGSDDAVLSRDLLFKVCGRRVEQLRRREERFQRTDGETPN